ncbi:hypothetical protein DES53_101736 [Roseimicrobium gellanilyticum]|uniref:Uncharacterized protein n=1 Tax=Roseimicrobium gellanilyticum TaxID=748857 RepID=A0A366HUI2_9BACT|nr:hypothetical protein [Roseimicrobium gellanilyticum]RBP47936.1 hypothetical protein DES53_101736 [Roseimicrobium gellanilyticum]
MRTEAEPIVRDTVPKPGSPDPIEVRAAEVAKRHGHSRVTDEDRKLAYDELRRMSRDQSVDGEVHH